MLLCADKAKERQRRDFHRPVIFLPIAAKYFETLAQGLAFGRASMCKPR